MSGKLQEHKHDGLIGTKKGNLTVESIVRDSPGRYILKCRCSCGNSVMLRPNRFLEKESEYAMCKHCHSIRNGAKKAKEHLLPNGTVFWWLTILGHETIHHKTHYVCKCKCGKEVRAVASDLKRGKVKSCGCYNHSLIAKHRMSGTKLYSTWHGIKSRCTNSNDPRYAMYGGRGIAICKEWLDFIPFMKWSYENGFSDGCKLSIDRIDNNKGYSPDNCRWTTNEVQQNNKSDCRYITYKGVRMTVTQLARRFGISPDVMLHRLGDLNWDIERAVSTPVAYRSKRKTT